MFTDSISSVGKRYQPCMTCHNKQVLLKKGKVSFIKGSIFSTIEMQSGDKGNVWEKYGFLHTLFDYFALLQSTFAIRAHYMVLHSCILFQGKV